MDRRAPDLSYLFHDISDSVRQFQAIQHKDRSPTINMITNNRLPSSALAQVRTNGARLLRGVDVRVNVVTDLPRSSAGKHRLVIVER